MSGANRSRAREIAAARKNAKSRLLGAALLLTGIAWMLRSLGVIDVGISALMSIFLIVLGIGLVFAAKWGPYWRLVGIGFAIVTILAATNLVGIQPAGGIGEVFVTPTDADALEPYALGVGELNIDLTNMNFQSGRTHVTANVSIGTLIVKIPAGLSVAVHSRAGLGGIRIFDLQREGVRFPLEDFYRSPDFDQAETKLVLELNVGIGEIEVSRGGP